MPYLTNFQEIKTVIEKLSTQAILWIDTEVADYQTSHPRLSLIQVLINTADEAKRVESSYILDVLEQPELVKFFIDTIMANVAIEKVFHNARYDLKFLGNRQAQTITCTLELAKKVPYYLLPVSDYSLKTLALTLGNFSEIDKQEQGGDWGKRPLRQKQLDYAQMDLIYLKKIHEKLLELKEKAEPDPTSENLQNLAQRYTEIEQQWHLLDSEMSHLKERVKKAMQAQNQPETETFKLSASQRKQIKVAFPTLAQLVQSQNINLDFPITLTKELQNKLEGVLEQLPHQVENVTSWRLIYKKLTDDREEE